MIISASRRTDLPAFYPEWLCRRFEEGSVLVRNPVNRNLISRIELSPATVDGIVFWTKNPRPLLSRLEQFKNYPYYFQFTLTPYGRDIEPYLPDKRRILIPTFHKLAAMTSPEQVVWRYDPVLFTPTYTADFHKQAFDELCRLLHDCTRRCVVSFLDMYQSIRKPMQQLSAAPPDLTLQRELLLSFADSAEKQNIELTLCCEALHLKGIAVRRGACIDAVLMESIGGYSLRAEKDKNQRPLCECCASIDIGAYDTCPAACRYCYANRRTVQRGTPCRPSGPLLDGPISKYAKIYDRPCPSCRIQESSLF